MPAFRTALSDFELELGDLVAEGDMVAYRLSWSAIHTGDFMGIPRRASASP